jgi:hypothetical protein
VNSINIWFEVKCIHLRDRNRSMTTNPSFKKKINTGLAFNLFPLHIFKKIQLTSPTKIWLLKSGGSATSKP